MIGSRIGVPTYDDVALLLLENFSDLLHHMHGLALRLG